MESIDIKYHNKMVLYYDKQIAQFINHNLNNFIETNFSKNKEYIKKLFSLDLEKIKNKNIDFYIKANELHLNCIDVVMSYIMQLEKYSTIDNKFVPDKNITYILKYEFELSYDKNWREYMNNFDIHTITNSKKKIDLYKLFRNRLIGFNYTLISFEKCNKMRLEEYNQTVYDFDYLFYHMIKELYIKMSRIMILYYQLVSKISKDRRKIFLDYTKKYFIANININYDIKM